MLLLKNISALLFVSLYLAGSAIADTKNFHHTNASFNDDPLRYSNVVDFTDPTIKGQTFLNLMIKNVKPHLDSYAQNGFKVADGDTLANALQSMNNKVVKQAGATADQLRQIGNQLSKKGKITFDQLPGLIKSLNIKGVNIYDATTYIALVSRGGVGMRFSQNNWAYHVNYAVGTEDKAEMTGRSFLLGPDASDKALAAEVNGANDISDKDAAVWLKRYVTNNQENHGDFYKTMFQTLSNCDTSGFKKLSDEGQRLLDGFLAVYVAEQDRHLMSGLRTHEWDDALLEFFITSAYYANQKEVYIYYQDKFHKIPMKYTNEVIHQYKKYSSANDKVGQWYKRHADVYDYWQRSFQAAPITAGRNGKQTDGRSTRSGFNIGKPQFRALSSKITAWEAQNNPEVVNNLKKLLKSPGEDLVEEFALYLINKRAPATITNANKISEAMTAFVERIIQDGPEIHKAILARRI